MIDPTNHHGANGISIVGIGSVVVEAPTALVKTGATPSGSHDIDGIFTVNNATGVTIQGLTVDGRHFGDDTHFAVGQHAAELVGIAYLNSPDGTINGVTVTGIREVRCRHRRPAQYRHLRAEQRQRWHPDNGGTCLAQQDYHREFLDVIDFQKAGIVITDANVDLHDSVVTGVGTVNTAQNGIQVSGSTGDISNNTISNIGYLNNDFAATGILAFDNNSLIIDGNSFTGALDSPMQVLASTVGLYVEDSTAGTITDNQIHDAGTGIVGLSTGSGSMATGR